MKLTAPQSKLIVFVAASGTVATAAIKKFDARVTNGLVKKGLLARSEDGASISITEAGKVAVPAPKVKKAKGEKKARPVSASKKPGVSCYCGCGKTTKNATRIFLQGHDARLRSHYLAVTRGEAAKSIVPTDREEVMQYLAKGAHWMTKKLSDAFAEAK
jgi:hypothetical protein